MKIEKRKLTINGVDVTVYSDGSVEKPNRLFKDNRLERTFGSNRDGYRQIRIGNIVPNVHQLVAKAFLDDFSNELQIDHINGNRSDNRPENLRMVTHQQNQMAFINKRDGASSKYRGVGWNKKKQKWRARISKGGHEKHLGLFSDELDAAIAYNKAALSLGFEKEALNAF